MSDQEIFRVLSQLQYDMGLLRELMFYTMAMLFVAGVAAVLTPLLSRRGSLVIENQDSIQERPVHLGSMSRSNGGVA